MLLSNAFADRQARFATSARRASTANGIAAKTMVQPEPGAPPG